MCLYLSSKTKQIKTKRIKKNKELWQSTHVTLRMNRMNVIENSCCSRTYMVLKCKMFEELLARSGERTTKFGQSTRPWFEIAAIQM